MTLLTVEGFDALASLDERFGGSQSGMSLDSTTKRTGSQSLKCTTDSVIATLPISSSPTSLICGFAIRFEEPLSTYVNVLDRFFEILTDTGSIQCWLAATSAGLIVMGTRSGVSSYPVLGTSSSGISINTWHYMEVKFTLSNSTAADDLIIKIDGSEVLNLSSGKDTLYSGTTLSSIGLAALYANVDTYFDDFYMIDENGSDNNDFLGDCKVETLYPDGNGNYSQFDGSDGNQVNNFELVDEAQHDGDTTYIEDDTADQRDSFTFDDMAATPSSIYGISVCGVVKKDSTGNRTGKMFYRRSSTDYDGSNAFGLSSDYLVEEEIWENDPVTTSPWIKTNIDASEFGIKVQS